MRAPDAYSHMAMAAGILAAYVSRIFLRNRSCDDCSYYNFCAMTVIIIIVTITIITTINIITSIVMESNIIIILHYLRDTVREVL